MTLLNFYIIMHISKGLGVIYIIYNMESEWTEVIKSKSKLKPQSSQNSNTKLINTNNDVKTAEEMDNIKDKFENHHGQYISDSIYDICMEIEQYKPYFNMPSTFEIEDFFDYYINKPISIPEEVEEEESEEELDEDTYI